jgi:hypothetical protein
MLTRQRAVIFQFADGEMCGELFVDYLVFIDHGLERGEFHKKLN